MIKVGFITQPLSDGNTQRGVGVYTRELLASLKSQASSHNVEIIEIKNNWDLRIEDCDLLHYPFFDLFYHTLPLVKKAKTIVTIHDVIPLEFPKQYPMGIKGTVNFAMQKLSLGNVDKIITDSLYSVNSINQYLEVPKSKITLTYLGKAQNINRVESKKLKLPKDFVLYVGGINWNKNIPSLVEACKRLNRPLVMVGQASEIKKLNLDHSELKHLKNIDLSGVTMLGGINDEELSEVFSRCAVYCQPSFSEGFGFSVIHALACGAAVACSSAGSLSEVGWKYVTYFDPYNLDDMCRAIKSAKKVPGNVSWAKSFDWAKTAEQTIQIYKNL